MNPLNSIKEAQVLSTLRNFKTQFNRKSKKSLIKIANLNEKIEQYKKNKDNDIFRETFTIKYDLTNK